MNNVGMHAQDLLDAVRQAQDQQGHHDSELTHRHFTAYVKAHDERLVRHCRKLAGPDDAADLAQDTWVVAWRKLAEVREANALWSFVKSTAGFLQLNARRKKREMLTHDGVLEATSEEAGVLRTMVEHEREQLLRASLATLPPLEQDAAWMRYQQHHTYGEMAVILDLPSADDVRRVLQNSKRHLQKEVRHRLSSMGRSSSWIRSMG